MTAAESTDRGAASLTPGSVTRTGTTRPAASVRRNAAPDLISRTRRYKSRGVTLSSGPRGVNISAANGVQLQVQPRIRSHVTSRGRRQHALMMPGGCDKVRNRTPARRRLHPVDNQPVGAPIARALRRALRLGATALAQATAVGARSDAMMKWQGPTSVCLDGRSDQSSGSSSISGSLSTSDDSVGGESSTEACIGSS